MIIDKPYYYWIYLVPSHKDFPLACLGLPSSKDDYLASGKTCFPVLLEFIILIDPERNPFPF